VITLLIIITLLEVDNKSFNVEDGWKYLINGLVVLLLLFFDTKYKLTKDDLTNKIGPIKGKIAIQEITQIVCGKTLWVGMRPATAKNALIITYKKYNEVYISPSSNELFVQEILKHNSAIEIIESSN
jgi:hypothetical protein